ncbi:synaptonemal complex protein 2 [Xyrauchen texanus]|uniref:synaptonemal complex protein 2 n=1 Tax=Xyrauchen texanus TaxID=154827 RepID=UPI0022419B0F|nr:synaptonemal complex protein 2 [Xyrauchen texanus]
MAPLQGHQVEKLVNEALKCNNFQGLEKFLQNESKEETTFQCSKQFITKLDKLFIRELDLGNVDNACLVLTILHKYGEMMWFERARKLWMETGSSRNEMLIKLAEDLFDALMVVHESCKEGTYAVTEFLLSHIGKLASNGQINIMIQKEASRKLNAILGKIPIELKKKKILSTQEASSVMNDVASRIIQGGAIQTFKYTLQSREKTAVEFFRRDDVKYEEVDRTLCKNIRSAGTTNKRQQLQSEKRLNCGCKGSSSAQNLKKQAAEEKKNYDLQVSLMEALCRMTSPTQRNELADCWFSMTFVSTAFKKIKDSEFETDCRKFLNMVNGMQGEGRSVYSYPCLEAFLDKYELLMPVDENLEAFWIDFNQGSQSISFYFSVNDKDAQDGQWDTLCISESEVHSYTVEVENGRKVLLLTLNELVSTGNLEGSIVTIKFSSSLDILQATEKVYGQAKNRKSVRKPPSVAKTPIQVNLSSQDSSQVLVPESQASPSQRTDGRNTSSLRLGIPCQSLTHPAPDTNNLQQQMVTPIKMKVSESCMYISGSVGRKQGSCSSSCVLPAVSVPKVKPALQMMSSSEKKQEFQLRELMMSKTSSNVSSLSVHCETKQKQANEIQAQNLDQQRIQKGKAKAEKYRKHITVDKVVKMVQADKEQEEETFDNSIVPDTQPAVKKGYSFSPGLWSLNSSKRRISVSGSLVALQKNCSKNSFISDGSSHPPPQRLSPAQHGFRFLTQKQMHTQLTQRLEDVLREQQGTDGHAPQRAPERRGSSLVPRAAGQGKEKVKMSVRSMPARPTQQRLQTHTVQDKASDTNKNNMENATESMVKMISNHYKKSTKAASPEPGAQFNIAPTNRYLFNKSWLPSYSEKSSKNSGLLKTHDTSKSAFQENEDVYAFKEDTAKIRVRKNVKSSELSRVDSSASRNSSTQSKFAKKPQPSKAAPANVKQNLFSDTDTENMTEISWLNSANRKPKPKVADYSRQPVKTTKPPADSTFKSPFTPLPSPKPVKEQVKQKRKKTIGRLERIQQTLPARTIGPGQKGETSSLDTSKEQSENSEKEKADKIIVQIQQDQRYDKGKTGSSPEHLTVSSSAQGSSRRQKSWVARLSSTLASPPSIEKMRSNEKPTTHLLSHTPLRSLSISPIEPDSLLEPLSPLKEIQASSFYKTAEVKDVVKPPSLLTIKPVSTTSRDSRLKPTSPQVELSPVHSLLTRAQPPFTSTGKEKSTLPSLLIPADFQKEHRGVFKRTSPASFDRKSVISVATTTQSSLMSVSNMAMICTELEKTPACHQESSERTEFKSGPTIIHKHSSSCHSASLTEREEESDEDKENKPPYPSQLAMNMKPRKLFKPNDKHWPLNKGPNVKKPINDQSSSEMEEETDADNGRRKKSCQRGQNKRTRATTISIEDVETVSSCMRSSHGQAIVETDIDLTQPEIPPIQEVGFICHQFSSELKRKIQNRSGRMDLYTKQSIKTFQQHMSSFSDQLHQYSFQKLEKVKQVLIGEIKSLEQDDIALRSMEEELMTCWKKQALAFHTYQEKGTKRLQHLKSNIKTDVCDSLEYEEQIFSSEMSLMKKNIKSVQDRFFNEMQEEELLSVRRGLQTLFLPDASRF